MYSKALLATLNRRIARLATFAGSREAAPAPAAPRRPDQVYQPAQAIRSRIDAALDASRRA